MRAPRERRSSDEPHTERRPAAAGQQETYIWIPLIILGGACVLTLAIYAMLSSNGVPGPFYGGGSQAPLWYFLVVGIQALTFTFPFSQAMSVTRREFYLGTLLTAALTSAILVDGLRAGRLHRDARRRLRHERILLPHRWIWEAGLVGAWLAYFAIAMLMFVIGFWAATIYKRWGTIAITVVLVGLGVLLVGAMWLIGRLDAWAQVFAWFAAQGALGLSLWGVLLDRAPRAGTSFLTLRRATSLTHRHGCRCPRRARGRRARDPSSGSGSFSAAAPSRRCRPRGSAARPSARGSAGRRSRRRTAPGPAAKAGERSSSDSGA